MTDLQRHTKAELIKMIELYQKIDEKATDQIEGLMRELAAAKKKIDDLQEDNDKLREAFAELEGKCENPLCSKKSEWEGMGGYWCKECYEEREEAGIVSDESEEEEEEVAPWCYENNRYAVCNCPQRCSPPSEDEEEEEDEDEDKEKTIEERIGKEQYALWQKLKGTPEYETYCGVPGCMNWLLRKPFYRYIVE
jgi:hypothetical protein